MPLPDKAVAAGGSHRRLEELERQLIERDNALSEAWTCIAALEAEAIALRSRLDQIASLAAGPASLTPTMTAVTSSAVPLTPPPAPTPKAQNVRREGQAPDALHPAARKLLAALAQHAPARFTWGQAATLAGLKPSGGHYNAGRKQLRDQNLVGEVDNIVAVKLTVCVSRAKCHQPRQVPRSAWLCGVPVSQARRPRCCAPSRPRASAM